MKRLSVKARVTLWVTGLLVLLLAAGMLYLMTASGPVSERQLEDTLRDVVADAVQSAEFDHGELDDSGLDFYRNGVSVFLYDTSGRLLAPRVNLGIQVDTLLEDQIVKTVDDGREKWMVHDQYAVQDKTAFWVRGMISLRGAHEIRRNLLLLTLVGIPVFALAAALGGYSIIRRAFQPIGRMAGTAEAITTGNDLSMRIPEDGSGDELSRLGRTVNQMLERLQQSFDRERRFTSDVSHELRTPVTVILSQCEYALSEFSGEEERAQCLSVILRQAERMSEMISQLLLLSRAENGRFQPDWEEISFSDLCEMAAQEFREIAAQSALRLDWEVPEAVMVRGDETLLIRLLNNLLQNALRYNREGGRITLRLTKESGHCTLEVADTGIGIRPENLEKIWERFYREDPARSGAGTGLGLSMVWWIAQVHGGSVRAESTPGTGSRFFVRLPII